MTLSPAGEMVMTWWQKLPEKFPDIELGAYVVMPNHFHGIIINVGVTPRGRPQDDAKDNGSCHHEKNNVGATPRGRLTDEVQCHNMMHIDLGDDAGLDPARDLGDHVGLDLARDLGDHVGLDPARDLGDDAGLDPARDLGDHAGLEPARDLGDHVGSPLRDIVGWFKTMTTNEYIRNVKHNGWPRFDKRLWQRNYYEHIIRTDRAFNNITTYIIENPQRWRSDRLFS
ncbi:hypothetical protein BLX24_07440 [Arsenicibacter rosenii]|uniref:Transposase IS200-like domain-containing protein n=2 Tax=Arsenicibacter rosenii TaxID=1750698 RepID=A0A1S2VLQ6_9BACT|nr:hypothetical protein BLX24_07440 [Arsenicibacter rosenii]